MRWVAPVDLQLNRPSSVDPKAVVMSYVFVGGPLAIPLRTSLDDPSVVAVAITLILAAIIF